MAPAQEAPAGTEVEDPEKGKAEVESAGNTKVDDASDDEEMPGRFWVPI